MQYQKTTQLAAAAILRKETLNKYVQYTYKYCARFGEFVSSLCVTVLIIIVNTKYPKLPFYEIHLRLATSAVINSRS